MKDRVDFNEKSVKNGELFIVCEVETEAFGNGDTCHTLYTEIYVIKFMSAVELHFPTTPFAEIRFSFSAHGLQCSNCGSFSLQH